MRPNTPPIWGIHPFVRLAPAFLFGILAGERHWLGLAWAWGAFLIALLVQLCWSVLAPARRWAWKAMTGASMFLMLASAGLTCSVLHHERVGRPKYAIVQTNNGFIAELQDVSPVDHGRYKARAATDILLYIDTAGMGSTPGSGDRYAIRAPCKPIRNRGNPGESDFAGSLATQGLFRQAYAGAGDLMLLDRKGPPFWESRFLASRRWIEDVLHRYLRDSAAADLASTLLTGHRAAMDPELLQAYANTGVVHVIAISGLHLGMIHGLLLWLLAPLFHRLGWSRTGGLVILPWLWIYACFTGASASVIRSAAMFTGIGIAKAMDKRQFLLNGLGSSAVILMALRPDWIADIGCQLSYAALLSIALFQPACRRLIEVRNPLGAGVRDLVTVTLAAQILTAPLVAWHFHRLPLLFLFSNLLVVPLSSLVLLLCLLICAFPWMPALAEPLGALTTVLIRIMNGHVLGMDAVPHSSLTDLQPTVLQVIILYAMIAVAAYWRTGGRNAILITVGMMALGYRILGTMEDAAHDRQKALIVFNIRKQSLYAIVEGRQMLVLAEATPGADTLIRDRCLLQAMTFYHCRPPVLIHLNPGKTVHWAVPHGSWSVTCRQGWTIFREPATGRSCTVLSGAFREEQEEASKQVPEGFLVADASLPLWKIPQWKSSFERVPSRFHSVQEQGAFVSDMDPSAQPAP